MSFLRLWPLWSVLFSVLALASAPVSAAEVGKLLPADAEMVLTVNLRQFLKDHQQTALVQQFLEQGHAALTAAQVALGIDLLQDVERLTCAFNTGQDGSLVLLVHGRFQVAKVRAALDLWQVSGRNAGLHLALVDDKTLAITSSKQAMDHLLARAAGQAEAGLTPGMRRLLDHGEREHLALCVNNMDAFLTRAAKWLEEDIAPALDAGDVFGKASAAQLVAWLRSNGPNIAAANLGLSIGAEEVRLQLGVQTRGPELAQQWHSGLDLSCRTAALLLKTIDHDLARRLADILVSLRFFGGDTTVSMRVTIPHAFSKDVLEGAWPGESALDRPLETWQRRIMSIRLWGPLPSPPGACEVEERRDVAYRADMQADPLRHRLDLYLPRGKRDYPVVVLVHGGSWVMGDNRCCGLYTTLGRFLAGEGIGVALPNYRLSPGVQHPEHIKDVARAVAWVRRHVAEYGGNTERIFLLGHSAGGHLVALLATDTSYLQAEGLQTTDLRGIIAVSGVYHLTHGPLSFTLGGTGPRAFKPEQMLPLRGDSRPLLDLPLPAIPARLNIYGPAFGDTAQERDLASPLTHVRRGLPPFLILSAEHDLPTLAGMADEFHEALLRAGNSSRLLLLAKRNHNSLMFSAISRDDPAARAILQFVHDPAR